MLSLDSLLDLKLTKTQRRLILVLAHIELKKVNPLFSQSLEQLKKQFVITILSIKNIFQLMEISFSTRELDNVFSVGIILMYQVEELLPLKHFLEQVPLELLVISFSFIDQLQFMSHHQHGETIMLSLQKLDSRLEHIDILTRKPKDLISMV